MIQHVEGLRAERKRLPLEWHRETPRQGKCEGVVRWRHELRRISRRAAVVAHSLGKCSGVEPLIDRSMMHGEWLAGNQVRTLEGIPVILPILRLADIERTAG